LKNQRVLVRARIRELAAESVAALIGPLRFQQITALDPKPMFVSLTVAHEGVSRGEVVGLGARVKEWARKVIARLAELMHPSGRVAPLIYDGSVDWHGNQSSRQPVGEVVASRTGEASGLMSAEAIGYIYAGSMRVRELIALGQLDVCSVEADVILVEEGARSIVEDVLAAPAIVLGDSRKQQPGFAGARVAMITEFMPDGDPPPAQLPAQPPAPPPANPPAQPPATPPAQPPAAPQLGREQLLQAIRDAGITAADLAPPVTNPPQPPASPPPPAPPERPPAQPQSSALDFTDPANNEFLPK
jgi:hypothetical protein